MIRNCAKLDMKVLCNEKRRITMAIGVIINTCSILFGGLFGTMLAHKLDSKLKSQLTLVFGVCSLGMGVSSIVIMQNLPAVIFAIIIGTTIGLLCHLGEWVNKGAVLMQKPISKLFKNSSGDLPEDEYISELVTLIVLFCASGTGIYGSLTAGMTGDNSILISKSILDFFTAAIFACQLGYVVSLVAIPQFVFFITLFLLAKFIFPLTTPTMIADFKACGGFLMLATGFRMMKLKEFPIADMLPAMVVVMPLSFIWINYILVWIS